MANTLKIKRGSNATVPQGQLAEPLFTTDTYDLYIGKGSGGNQRFQKYIASGTSSQFLKGDGSLDSTTYQATSEKGQNNGYASLDSGGKVPVAQLPNSIMEYLGTWDASTNTPTLANGTGNAGDVYICSVAGTVNFGAGPITFAAGDWVVYSGSIWQKSINSNSVASVNGQTGAVVLYTDDISEDGSPVNLWFTNARARTAISLTTSGTSGAATYDNSTGVLNVPNYGGALSGYLPLTGGTLTGALNGTSASFNSTVTTPAGFYIDANTYLYEGILRLTDLVNKKNILQLQATASGHYITSTFLSGGSQQAIYLSAKSTAGQNVTFNTDGTTTFGHGIIGTSATFSGQVGIGTSPTKALEILSNTAQDGIKISGSSNPRLTIIDTTNNVQFDALTTDTEAVIRTDTNHPLHFSTNGTLRLTIAASTGAATFSGRINSTAAQNQQILNWTGTTGYGYIGLINTTGFTLFGVEGSTSGVLQTGNGAYSTTLTTVGTTRLSLGTNQIERLGFDGTTGAATFTSTVTATQYTATSTGGSGLRVYGGSGTNQWDVYLNSTNLRFSDNTGTGSVVFDRPATFSSSVTAGGDILANGSSIFTKAASGGYQISLNAQASTQKIRFDDLTGGAYGVLAFEAGNGSGGFLERMRITSGGLIGVNTTNPFNFGSGSGMVDVRSQNTSAVCGVFISNSDRSASIVNYINNAAGAFIGTSTNHYLDIGTNDVGRMRITSGGNVGIGETSPGVRLHVVASGAGMATFASTSANGGYVGFRRSTTTVFGYIGSGYELVSGGANTDIALTSESGGILFATSQGTERMRITSGGYLKASNDGTYIGSTGTYHEFTGTTAASDTLSLRHKAASQPFGQSITFSAATPNNLDQYFLYCQDSTNVKAIIWSNGTFNSRTNTYTSVSDINLKQDIIDASSQWNDIKNLTVRKFRLKDEVAADPNYPYHIGVVAQELELISPNLVDNIPNYKFIDGEKVVDGHIKTVKYSILYMKAIKALQEAMERIEKLEAKLN